MIVASDVADLDLGLVLRRGDRIVLGQACGEPGLLIDALVAQASAIGDLTAFAATSFSGRLGVAAADAVGLTSMGAIGALRTLTAAHRLAIIPCHVSQVGPLIEQGVIGCDVLFVQVSPPDATGNHSFGLTSDFIQAAIDKARVVVAEINDQVPYTFGATALPGSRIDLAVRASRRPVEVRAAQVSEIDETIAGVVANYIADGAVLQVGIGAVPDVVLRQVSDRRDLGVHSGMIGDALVDLVEAGVVTNARKPFDQGISITGALIGTRKLYDFAHRNPAIGMRASSYTHDAAVLGALPGLVTINSAVEIDLTGQVNAEQSGDQYIGGTGGQADFVRAGARSRGGHSIIALPATARGGKASRIVAQLSGPVTTTRSDVDVVVTEFGAAELRGQTLAERARRLTAIAHPDFRDALDRDAADLKRRGF